jgi:hypothetical protein
LVKIQAEKSRSPRIGERGKSRLTKDPAPSMDLEDKDMDTKATTKETSKAKIKSEAKPSVR